MSRAFHALAKLARSEAEAVQRQLNELLTEDERLLARIAARAAQVQIEVKLAIAPSEIAAFNRFVAAQRELDREDQAARAGLVGQIDGLRDELGACFREAKKLETLLEERALALRRNAARVEQALADERAGQQAGR